MKTFSTEHILRSIALLCLAGVGVALVSQYGFDMQPCAWCVLQRLILLAIAAVCGLATAGWRSARIHVLGAALAAILAVCGMLAAWYQYTVAAHMFSCDQTFADKFVAGSGLDAALPWLFGIYASCMDARVSVLGIEYALWALGLFALCLALAVWVLLRARSR
ncbi:disulfide bond formation protein B [Castellaniella sp. GW247-6E4]|uniref:disulfide bond formation protein B n=1 Tax=Castellaniella sp. GW247-6E4 TaxID=3140380 RepID=UPI0033149EAA